MCSFGKLHASAFHLINSIALLVNPNPNEQHIVRYHLTVIGRTRGKVETYFVLGGLSQNRI